MLDSDRVPSSSLRFRAVNVFCFSKGASSTPELTVTLQSTTRQRKKDRLADIWSTLD